MRESSASLKSILKVVAKHTYLVIVPVFNAKDMWNAAKIAKSKFAVDQSTLISCLPVKRDYFCVFGVDTKPDTPFPVYKASRERVGHAR